MNIEEQDIAREPSQPEPKSHGNTDELNHTRDEQTVQGHLALLTLCLGCAVFLVSIDRTIVAVAIPRITDEFHSFEDVGWYGSAYLICMCALQPLFGRVYGLFDIKLTYLGAMVFFEIGSLVCALAPTSATFILGRAIAGCGSGGVLSGSFVVVAHAIPLRLRPVYTATVGMIHSLGAIVAPLIGGGFTSGSTWRWCFWLNLPIGIPGIVAMCFLFHPHQGDNSDYSSIIQRLKLLDLLGATLLLGSTTMLFLALQYAAADVPWNSSLIAGLLVGAGVTFVTFSGWLLFRQDNALVPPRILVNRTVASSSLVAITLYGALVVHVYYLPTYFQAIRGSSAIGSAVEFLPYILACSIFSVLAGILVSRMGFFTPPCVVGCGIAVVGAGLLTTLDVHSSKASWVNFQLLSGIGAGLALYQGFIGVQVVLPKNDIAIGTSLITFSQAIGGALAVSVGDVVLLRSIRGYQSRLKESVNVDKVIALGATRFRKIVPDSALNAFLQLYNDALSKVFIFGAIFAGFAFLGSCFMEFRRIEPKTVETNDESIAEDGRKLTSPTKS